MASTLAILIVDDHPGMCATLQDILENEGYEAHVALTGAEAIAQCQARRFDVILMDVLMPDLSGVEVYRRIKTLAPDTRVIMMSAYSVEDLKREALAAGAIAFLPKPLEVEVVLRLVQEVKSPPILLVMGDPDESAALAAALPSHQYRTYRVQTAEEALELAQQICFQIIFIDTRLPTMPGLDLYLALKDLTPTSVAIMLAETDPAFVAQAEEAVRRSAYAWMPKPLDLDRLLALLADLQRQRQSDRLDKPGDPYGAPPASPA